MQNNILLISGNYYPEPTGIGKYNHEMIKWLADHGFNCYIISTYPYYPFWKIQPPYTGKNKWFSKEVFNTEAGNTITIYRCPHYIPDNPTGKKRIILDLSYFTSVCLRLILLTGKKFDYVMSVSPPLFAGIAGMIYKKTHKTKFLYHVQDLQIDIASKLKMIKSQKLLNTLFKMEKQILKSADIISSISPEMVEKLKIKSNKPVYFFPNWVDTKSLYPLPDKTIAKKSFGFDPTKPIILYSGSIGEKQGLDVILDIAEQYKADKKNVQFVICSSGPYKNVLEKSAIERKIDNIKFLALQPYEKLNMLLNMADIHLIIQKADVAGNLMPSKLNSILSIGGLCIVTANEGSDLYDIITKNKMGLTCIAEDAKVLQETINYALSNDFEELRTNARNYAEQFLSIDKIMQQHVNNALTR